MFALLGKKAIILCYEGLFMLSVTMESHKDALTEQGFCIIDNVFSTVELVAMTEAIISVDQYTSAFRRTSDLFAIRTFLQTIPAVNKIIWNKSLLTIIHRILGLDYFVVKSIYFDKAPASNWFVAWHQDLTISVDRKIESDNFSLWTQKQGQIAAQPSRQILESIYTIRIHLDDCDASNGALKVIPGSHKQGILRSASTSLESETLCSVKAGGVMIMRPLLMHASGKSISDKRRRVIHIECSNNLLPDGISWREYAEIPQA
jgi:hypothetical protein